MVFPLNLLNLLNLNKSVCGELNRRFARRSWSAGPSAA